MSVHAYVGKPGAGKSYTGMELLIDELRLGKRPVVTNLPVRFQPWINGAGEAQMGLVAYLKKTYDSDFDCEKRIRVIEDEHAGHFYTKRGGQHDLPLIYGRTGKHKDKPVAFETGDFGGSVLYIIDEAWKFFGARNWTETEEATLFYFSQHRHFGDDVLLLTQNLKQIDSALIRLCQDYTVIINRGNLRIGWFKQPDFIELDVYSEPPTSHSVKPMFTKRRTIDKKGLAQCYDTSAGVGISGRFAADIGKKRKGLAFYWMIAFIVALVLIGSQIPNWAGRGVAQMFGPVKVERSAPSTPPAAQTPPTGPPATQEKGSVASVFRSLVNPRGQILGQSSTGTERMPGQKETEEIYLTGYLRSGTNIWIYLSDGTFLTQKDPRLKFVGEEFVIVGGTTYRFKPVR